MNYRKLYYPILTLIFTTIFIGCSAKSIQNIPKQSEKSNSVDHKNYKLNSISSKITKRCHAHVLNGNDGDYIKIHLEEKSDFRNGSYLLTKDAKEKLHCVASILKEEKVLYIVVTGHANDNKNNQENQHLSDNRAISLAELLYNDGIRDEIFAKGCSNKLPNLDNTDENNKLINRKINIYIYTDKSNIKNHCRD